VDVSLVRADPGLKTGITASFSAEDRALVTYPGAIAALTAEEIPEAVLAGFAHLHVSSYYLQTGLQPGLPALFAKAKAMGLTVSLDPGVRPGGTVEPEDSGGGGILRCVSAERDGVGRVGGYGGCGGGAAG
jgi:sugar/nucleoside kinase (ribokinase family)